MGHGSFDYDFKHKIDYKWDHNNSIHICEVIPFGKIMYTCFLLVLPMWKLCTSSNENSQEHD